MSLLTRKKLRTSSSSHPYLAGNFAPVSKSWPPTPVTWTGDIPQELHGGMYVRNGGNPATNSDLGREAHWFDGDGMLSGVWFQPSPANEHKSIPNFVNQFILTDVYMSSVEHDTLRTPILPSIATLVNPASSFFWILWRILRTVLIVLLSHLPGSKIAIKRISVANTSVLFHDGRALATCESGPPMRVTLPELETVGWFKGNFAEGEPASTKPMTGKSDSVSTFGGRGLLSWMKEWTTGHPKVDQTTGELVLFHCTFAPPYVHYSVVPTHDDDESKPERKSIMNAAVPGCTGGKMMHDFGVSRHSTVILDLPLSLTPLNLAKNKPVVVYEPKKPARFGVFPRRDPGSVRWFETAGCCIFHTANTWDELDANGEVAAVNLLACRLTSASLVFSSANIEPPPHPDHIDTVSPRPMSFFAKYDEDEDPEKFFMDESTPLLVNDNSHASSSAPPRIPISYDDQEQCRLYYYRFQMDAHENIIPRQFALSAIPFEFPTVSPLTDMAYARYIYGCSTSNESFGAALGKATKIDLIVRMDVTALLNRADESSPTNITGCIDERTVDEILASKDHNDPIKAFRLPPNHYAQEPRFIPRQRQAGHHDEAQLQEEDGYLMFYVFDEDQLDGSGECIENSHSELWVVDAKSMETVVCKIRLPTRIPYGLHGNWFNEDQIKSQRAVQSTRRVPEAMPETMWSSTKRRLVRSMG